jgi:hypothetical protein
MPGFKDNAVEFEKDNIIPVPSNGRVLLYSSTDGRIRVKDETNEDDLVVYHTDLQTVSGNLQTQIDALTSETVFFQTSGLIPSKCYGISGGVFVETKSSPNNLPVIGVSESSTKLILSGVMTVTGGLVAGSDYYLGLTNGNITTPRPSYSVGDTEIYIGTALSSTKLFVNIDRGVRIEEIYNTQVVSGNYNILPTDEKIFVNAGTGCTITLESSPPNNRSITVKKISGTGDITIDGNGKTIDSSISHIIRVSNESVTMIYSQPNNGWYIF